MLPTCQVCGKQEQILKRCTRCSIVFYCSRDCQAKDWSKHKKQCGKIQRQNYASSKQLQDAGSESGVVPQTKEIWDDQDVESNPDKLTAVRTRSCKIESGTRISCTKPIDFQAAFDNLPSKYEKSIDIHRSLLKRDSSSAESQTRPVKGDGAANSTGKKTYLLHNKIHSDAPMLDITQPYTTIVVKCNKNKHQVKVQDSWSGEDTLKTICSEICIPFDHLKLVHKGRLVHKDSIQICLKPKAVFQAIGEQAESESGVDVEDIDVIMKQLHVDRNTAVKALKKTNDVVDAIFEISNK